MRRLIYSLQFTGHAAPAGDGSGVLKATTSAASCTITTVAGPEGVRGTVAAAAGDGATCASEITFTGETTFREAGTIAFGEHGHALRFSTIGQGRLRPSADPRCRHGAAIWQVDGGEGQFAGAGGVITANFLVSDAGELSAHHCGVLFVK